MEKAKRGEEPDVGAGEATDLLEATGAGLLGLGVLGAGPGLMLIWVGLATAGLGDVLELEDVTPLATGLGLALGLS